MPSKTSQKDWWSFLNDEADVFPLVGRIQSITGIPAFIQVIFILGYMIFQAFEGAYAEFIAICFGTIYPIFKSVQALQTEDDYDDDQVWLTYWVVYGFTVVADQYAGFILEILPAYYLLKLGFFIWLQIPGQLMGAKLVYRWIFAPLYNFCGPTINHYVNQSEEQMYDFNNIVAGELSKAQGAAMDKASQKLLEKAIQ